MIQKILISNLRTLCTDVPLFSIEPVTLAEARAIGEQLIQLGFFNDESGASVHIGQKGDACQLKFVIDAFSATAPEIKAAFIGLSRGIAAEALEDHPVVLHLGDGYFRTLQHELL
jgi:hypothetical protein